MGEAFRWAVGEIRPSGMSGTSAGNPHHSGRTFPVATSCSDHRENPFPAGGANSRLGPSAADVPDESDSLTTRM
nr:hypothetical protein JVH1_2435 [Rhodococcus sp. JVH1]